MTPSLYLGDEVVDATTGTPPVQTLPHQEDVGQSGVSLQTNLDQHNSGLADKVAVKQGSGLGLLSNQAIPVKRTIRSLDTPELTKGNAPNFIVYRRGTSQSTNKESLMEAIPSIYKPLDTPREDKMPLDLKTVASKFILSILKDTHSTVDVLKRLSVHFIAANRGQSNSDLQQRDETSSKLVKDEELPVNDGRLKEVTVSDMNLHQKARNVVSVFPTTGIRHDNGISTYVNGAGARARGTRSLDTQELTKTDPSIKDVYIHGRSESSSTESVTSGVPNLRDSNVNGFYEPVKDLQDEEMPTDPKTVASEFIKRVVKDTLSTFDLLKRLTLQFIIGERDRPASTSDLQHKGETTSQLAEDPTVPDEGLKEVPASDLNHHRNTTNILPVLATTATIQHDTGRSTFVNRGGPHKRTIKSLDTPELTKADPPILGAYRRESSQSSSKETSSGVIPTVRGSSGLYRPVHHPQHDMIPTGLKTIASRFIERIMRNSHSTLDVIRRLTLQFINGNRGRPASAPTIKKKADGTSQFPAEKRTVSGSGVNEVPISHLNIHRNSRERSAVHHTLNDNLPENLIHSYIHKTQHQGDEPLDAKDQGSDNEENYRRGPRHLVYQGNSLHTKGTIRNVADEESFIEISRKSTSIGNQLRTNEQQKLSVDPKIFPGAVIPDCVPDSVETLYLGASKLGHVTNLTFSYLTKLVFLSLNDSGVVSVSKDTFRNNNDLVELILDWNPINDLHAFTLQNNPKLRVFSAMMTRLTTVDARFFDHCPQLESVIISNNLETIPPTIFRNNPLIKHVDLHFNWLADIPESIFFWSPQLESVDLSYNSIVELPESLFFNSVQLRSANLSHNRIWSLSEDTFSMTPLLEILRLDVNELSVLPPKTLAKLPALKELILRANHLSHLHEETFSANRQLRILDLSYNNIESLPDGIFRHLSNLCHLLLTGNLLTTLGSAIFANNGNIVTLNLDVNRISALPQGIFDFTPELESLHLQNNEIGYIDVDTFKKTAKLQELDLSTNKLGNLTQVLLAVDVCENLEKFSLLNNPWICECRNAEYVEVLRKFKTESLYCLSSTGLVYDDFEELLNEPECTEQLQNESSEGIEYGKENEHLQ